MYQEIIKECREWFRTASEKQNGNLKMSIEKDDQSGFVGNIESRRYIAQIIVSEGEFKPCRYVEMTIFDTSKGVDQKPVFWYGDKEGTAEEEIIENLNKGIDLMTEWRSELLKDQIKANMTKYEYENADRIKR